MPHRQALRLSGSEPLEQAARHCLAIADWQASTIRAVLTQAQSFLEVVGRPVKKVPLLRGKTVMNLFFEPSTRTRVTFELAAKRLSADVISLGAQETSAQKGESLLDTLHNLEAMGIDVIIVRHRQSGAAAFLARHAGPSISIVNAGDGSHAHPTQALLDCFTIMQHKGQVAGLVVAIVGDIRHSRVARSLMRALDMLDVAELRLCAPRTLMPADLDAYRARPLHDLATAVRDADVVIALRLQKERMAQALLPSEQEYFRQYGLTRAHLAMARPDAIVMHPGPINRGVEIAGDLADDPQAVILQQVTNGIAVRMAVLALCVAAQKSTALTG